MRSGAVRVGPHHPRLLELEDLETLAWPSEDSDDESYDGDEDSGMLELDAKTPHQLLASSFPSGLLVPVPGGLSAMSANIDEMSYESLLVRVVRLVGCLTPPFPFLLPFLPPVSPVSPRTSSCFLRWIHSHIDAVQELGERIGNVRAAGCTQTQLKRLPVSTYTVPPTVHTSCSSAGKQAAANGKAAVETVTSGSSSNTVRKSTKEEAVGAKQCMICLMELATGDAVLTLPCFHMFHKEEIGKVQSPFPTFFFFFFFVTHPHVLFFFLCNCCRVCSKTCCYIYSWCLDVSSTSFHKCYYLCMSGLLAEKWLLQKNACPICKTPIQ